MCSASWFGRPRPAYGPAFIVAEATHRVLASLLLGVLALRSPTNEWVESPRDRGLLRRGQTSQKRLAFRIRPSDTRPSFCRTGRLAGCSSRIPAKRSAPTQIDSLSQTLFSPATRSSVATLQAWLAPVVAFGSAECAVARATPPSAHPPGK